MDKGANKVGEFSLTDIRFSKIDRFMANTLFDENYGGKYGNCHIAVGSSYSDTYDGDPAKLTKEKKRELRKVKYFSPDYQHFIHYYCLEICNFQV